MGGGVGKSTTGIGGPVNESSLKERKDRFEPVHFIRKTPFPHTDRGFLYDPLELSSQKKNYSYVKKIEGNLPPLRPVPLTLRLCGGAPVYKSNGHPSEVASTAHTRSM
jgi:hypothetical protein